MYPPSRGLLVHSRNRIFAWVVGGVLFLVPVIACSSPQGRHRVVLQPTFHGHVTVLCSSTTDSPTSIAVDPTGRTLSAPCPKESSEVTVLRDNKIVQPDHGITWDKTGDGIQVGFEFDVQ